MINQLEIPMYLEDALPEIAPELKVNININSNAYDAMNILTLFTYKHIQQHDFNIVKRCFRITDKLYDKGNAAVKGAIENVFVYSFTKMFLSYPSEKQKLLAMIPMTLYSLYITQVCNKGC